MSQKLKRSYGTDGNKAFFLKKIASGISDNIARIINMITFTERFIE